MTTIAYSHRDKTVSVDGISTAGGRVADKNSIKWVVESGVKFFFTGSVCDEILLLDFYFKRQDKSAGEIPDCIAVIVDESDCVFLVTVNNDAILEKSPLTYDYTIGSGCDFAISAMDFGKSSREAVEHAATRCIYTGGKITTYDIKTGEFA